MRKNLITGFVASILSTSVFAASLADFEGSYRLVSESKQGVCAPQLTITSDTDSLKLDDMMTNNLVYFMNINSGQSTQLTKSSFPADYIGESISTASGMTVVNTIKWRSKAMGIPTGYHTEENKITLDDSKKQLMYSVKVDAKFDLAVKSFQSDCGYEKQ